MTNHCRNLETTIQCFIQKGRAHKAACPDKADEYKEHKFSDDDRKNLRETGNLGRVVDIVDRETGEIIPSYISIDPVSYTHLDVYKRQAWRSGEIARVMSALSRATMLARISSSDTESPLASSSS